VTPSYTGLNTVLGDILGVIDKAGIAVDATLQPVYFTAGCLMLVIACVKFMWSRDLAPLAGFVVHFVMLMAVVTLSKHWMPTTEGYMSGMGTYGARIGGFVTDHITPSATIIRGLTIADKMYTENVSWMRTVFGTTEDSAANIVMLLVCVGTIAIAALMSIFLMLFYVVMKLASVVALVFLIFILFEWSRFMGAPGIARFLAYGVQMFVMTIVAGLMFTTLDGLELSDRLTANEAIATFVIVAFFAFLFLNTTTIAKEQISGMPILSLNEAGSALTKGAMAGLSMLPGIGKLGMGALGSMPSMPSFRGGNAIGGGSIGMGGPSGGAGGGMRQIGGGAPSSAMRMLNKPTIIDTTWTDAKDIGPKSAQRMLGGQKSLPPPSNRLPPPPPKLPPPSRF
jgi:hypothetical protein